MSSEDVFILDGLDEEKEAISFGLNELLLMISSVLAGILSYSTKNIIFTLMLISLSSSLPDTISYYQNIYQENKDAYKSAKISSYVFLTQFITTILLISPLIVVHTKLVGVMISYIIIITLNFINLRYIIGYDLSKTALQMSIYSFISLIVYGISVFAKNYFKITI